MLRSLLAGLLWLAPAQAAEQLEVQLDGLKLPIDLVALEAWSRAPGSVYGDLRAWLDLLDANGQERLQRILRAPPGARPLLRSAVFG